MSRELRESGFLDVDCDPLRFEVIHSASHYILHVLDGRRLKPEDRPLALPQLRNTVGKAAGASR